MMDNTLLELVDLHVTYAAGKNPVKAVNGVNFSIGKRETIGLVG
jgi:ABC-type dipeptide/oligopeptide/nickel transport system ATPase component